MIIGRRELLLGSLRAAGVTLLVTRWGSLASAAVSTHAIDDLLGEEIKPMAVPPETVANDPALAARIKAISNVFEVGRPQADYGYVENLEDGRGYTVTNYGFCTGTGEVGAVMQRCAVADPATPLIRFLPLMPPAGSADNDLPGFADLWRREASTSDRLAAACEAEANELFFYPAMASAKAANIRSPIGQAVFYDTWLQHGADADPDSLHAIYSRTVGLIGAPPQCSETDFIHTFLKVRRTVLLNPANAETRSVWRESVSRIDALLNLLDHNPSLIPPIRVSNTEWTKPSPRRPP
jgi:chitosanase